MLGEVSAPDQTRIFISLTILTIGYIAGLIDSARRGRYWWLVGQALVPGAWIGYFVVRIFERSKPNIPPVCPKGHVIQKGASFCPSCGTKIP